MRLATIIMLAGCMVLAGCAKKNTGDEELVPQVRLAEDLAPGPALRTPIPDERGTDVYTPPVDPTPTPPPPVETHTVKRGDTLWALAVKYYADGQQWTRIARANGITDAGKLRVGAVLKIPR